MEIVGVSFDSPDVNRAWAEDEGFQFELWTDDEERTLAITYGAASSSSATAAARVSVILDADGVLLLEYTSVSPSTGPQEALEDCQKLFGG